MRTFVVFLLVLLFAACVGQRPIPTPSDDESANNAGTEVSPPEILSVEEETSYQSALGSLVGEDVSETDADGNLVAGSSRVVGGVGTLAPRSTDVSGRAAIRDVVRSNTDAVRACYETALRADPELAGRITVEFVIAVDGSVSRADVHESTLPSDEVASCLLAEVSTWTFPQLSGPGIAVVKFPFVFATGPDSTE